MAPTPDLSTLGVAPDEARDSFLQHPSPALLYEPGSGCIIAANPAAEALYGWTSTELARMTLADIRPPESRERLREKLDVEQRQGGTLWHRATHWRKDGHPLDVEVLSQPMRLDGRPVRQALIVDVTARTRAEDLFRGVADQSLTGIYVLQDGRFAYINPRMAEMFGYTVDEVMSEPDPWRMLTDEARGIATEKSAGRLAGRREQVRYTLHARRRDRSEIVVEVYGSSLQMNGRPALLGTVLDVTERVRADAALKESERRFRAAFDQAMTGMAITSLDGQWLRVNPALTEMLGYSPEELTGMTFHTVTHPDDLQANLDLKDALIRGERVGYRMEKRFHHRDGSVIWAALNVALVRDEHGAPQYLVSQMNDITAQKRAELALGESESKLRHAQKMEAVGRLAGGVAHDFNNLLTVIGSNAEMGEELAREGQASTEEFAEIRAAVERAASLTRQLLAFSRRQVLAPASLSLNEVVADAERMLRRVIGEDIVLETRLDGMVGEVIADRGQLEQVLMNLVVNSRDAMPEGGRVVIATRREPDGRAALEVIDTGTGMDAETQAHAFEPFFTTKEMGKGTGLGLSTVYGIAQQSGGDVTIRSAEGEGTIITLTLPSSPARTELAAGRRQASDAAGAQPSEGDTILLVEDEAAVRAVARRILNRFGYSVLEARNGADALLLWADHASRIRLVLTDAVMPVMGGRALMERLQEIGAGVPVIFMSGYADGERGGELPPGALLIGKPFSAEALVACVGEVLEATRAAPAASSPTRPG